MSSVKLEVDEEILQIVIDYLSDKLDDEYRNWTHNIINEYFDDAKDDAGLITDLVKFVRCAEAAGVEYSSPYKSKWDDWDADRWE